MPLGSDPEGIVTPKELRKGTKNEFIEVDVVAASLCMVAGV
jgi:hypothetical protein